MGRRTGSDDQSCDDCGYQFIHDFLYGELDVALPSGIPALETAPAVGSADVQYAGQVLYSCVRNRTQPRTLETFEQLSLLFGCSFSSVDAAVSK